MEENQKNLVMDLAKNLTLGAAGAGSGIGAIAVCGKVTGLSAAGITSGLATLGLGSMVWGIGTVVLIGYGTYRLSNAAFDALTKKQEDISSPEEE